MGGTSEGRFAQTLHEVKQDVLSGLRMPSLQVLKTALTSAKDGLGERFLN
jgi:hypothetical protein